MVRGRCRKCGNVFEYSVGRGLLSINLMPGMKLMRCPACGRLGLIRVHVDDPITWPADRRVWPKG